MFLRNVQAVTYVYYFKRPNQPFGVEIIKSIIII